MIKEEDLEYIYNNLSSEEKMKFQDSKILVTGCGGFIGYYLMSFFDRYQNELGIKKVIGLDNFLLRKTQWIEDLSKKDLFEIKEFDIIYDNISDIENAEDVNLIIHMASIASPIFYRQYPMETIDANIGGLKSLLEFYKNRNITGFLFFSSSEIYGNPDEEHIPTNEEYNGNTSCVGPRACYDESKRFGETICEIYANKYDMPITIVRPFNNFGPGLDLDDKRVSADFENAIHNNKDIVILSDGTPTRTFCYITDAIVGYLKILVYGSFNFFNIGQDQPELTIKEFAKIYRDVAKEVYAYDGNIIYKISEDVNYLTDNPQRRCPDLSKSRELLNFNPKISIKEGIRRSLQFNKETDGGKI